MHLCGCSFRSVKRAAQPLMINYSAGNTVPYICISGACSQHACPFGGPSKPVLCGVANGGWKKNTIVHFVKAGWACVSGGVGEGRARTMLHLCYLGQDGCSVLYDPCLPSSSNSYTQDTKAFFLRYPGRDLTFVIPG